MVRRAGRESGHALLLALMIIVLVGVAGTILTTTLGLHLKLARDESQRIQLVAMSDAAVAESLAEMAADPGFGGLGRREFGPGQIESVIEILGPNRRRIIATSMLAGGLQLRVAAEVRLQGKDIVVTSWQRLPAE